MIKWIVVLWTKIYKLLKINTPLLYFNNSFKNSCLENSKFSRCCLPNKISNAHGPSRICIARILRILNARSDWVFRWVGIRNFNNREQHLKCLGDNFYINVRNPHTLQILARNTSKETNHNKYSFVFPASHHTKGLVDKKSLA